MKDPELSLQYGREVNVTKTINSKQYLMNQQGIVDPDLLVDQLLKQKCRVNLLKPQLFSASLAKLLCLGDEILETDNCATAIITPYTENLSEISIPPF